MAKIHKLKNAGLFCPFQAPGHPLQGGCQRTCALFDDELGGCALLVIARAMTGRKDVPDQEEETSEE